MISRSASTLGSRLETLQCHFTWDLDLSRSKLLSLRDKLEDIGSEEGYSWLGHIYNLQGYVQYQLGFTNDAHRFFSRAAEAFRQMRNTVSDEGPWLVVNQSNLAWIHHHLGHKALSQTHLLKVSQLMDDYPSPAPDELHPEIYAEKAWTLMKLSVDKKLQASSYFQRAIRMQPDAVEWHTSHVIVLINALNLGNKDLEADVLEKVKITKEHNPDNLYLAALYLEECARKGKKIQQKARELAMKVLRKPVSSYSGIKPLLRLYSRYLSVEEATDLAEEILERHPEERYLKKCAAACYQSRILLHKVSPLEEGVVLRAVGLHQQVISLYPHSSLQSKIALANIYGDSDHRLEADRIYKELLESDLDPEETQMLHNYYAKYVHVIHQRSYESIEHHMRAAEIRLPSVYRDSSIRTLQKIRDRNRNRMCEEIETFLAKLDQ